MADGLGKHMGHGQILDLVAAGLGLDGVQEDHLVQNAVLNALDSGAGQNAVGSAGVNLLGTANLDQQRLYRQVYQRLGIRYGIVTSVDGYDEISLTGNFKVVYNDEEHIYQPIEFGMELLQSEDLYGGATLEEAKAIFDAVLENRSTLAQKNVVLINSAFAIHVIEQEKSFQECLSIARESLESGKALNALKKYVELNS